jgi:hypothetical protein
MAEYLVELYVSRDGQADLERAVARVRAAAEELTREGAPVRCLRTIFVPEDETCFFLYESASAEAAGEATRRAGLFFDRVVEAIDSKS